MPDPKSNQSWEWFLVVTAKAPAELKLDNSDAYDQDLDPMWEKVKGALESAGLTLDFLSMQKVLK